MKTNKKGISLIVLVITIIVMIILATAIILSISGSDVRGKAEEAVSTTDLATAKETVAVAYSEWELNYDELKDEYDDFKDYATKKLEKSGITNVQPSNEGAVNIIYTDKNGDTAIIPEGFSVSTVKSEQTIDDGLVIVDKKGNEFVWVPVDNYARFQRTTAYKPSDAIADPGNSYTEPYSYDLTITAANDLTGEYTEYAKMIASIKENKGFYIGRYEAGTSVERTNAANGTTDVLVQKNKPVYNYVAWGPSMTKVTGDVTYNSKNQGKGAVELSRQMYRSSKSVVSTLCYGVQWDVALQFIATKDADYPTNSTGKGYYTYDENLKPIEGMEEKAQPTGYYAINNIYDMGGNVVEWTMEAYSTSNRVPRGGDYYCNGSGNPASNRFNGLPDVAYARYGFRLTLYIK